MTGRLTGLEYRWFSKGQLLATRYQEGEPAHLDPAAAAVIAEAADDARASTAGPDSLRRVAARFALDADELDADWMNTPSSKPTMAIVASAAADRRIAALRCLATRFKTAAAEVEARQ
jgi:hypothetical protein